MPLTDTAIRNAKPSEKSVKMFDGAGLYLEITPAGGKLWRLKYRFKGAEKRIALGAYPAVGLKDARDRRDEAKRHLAAGRDPSAIKQARKSQDKAESERTKLVSEGKPLPGTFEAVAREWIGRIHADKVSAGHAERTLIRFENDAFPWIGTRPLGEITAPELLSVIRRVEDRGAIATAHRLKDAAGQVFRYGVANGLCERNPAADLRDALKPVQTRHLAAIIEPLALGKLLRDMEGYAGQPVTRLALKLSALLLLRPGELRHLEWDWINEEAATLTIPAEAMKRDKAGKANGQPHIVPLATQSLALLRELRRYTDTSRYVFPALTSSLRPMSVNAVRSALRRMGYANDEMTAHGFRATARTLAAERLGIAPEVVEAQLAHAVADALGRAYNRTQFTEQRQQMMQAWSDYLDKLKTGAEIIPLRA